MNDKELNDYLKPGVKIVVTSHFNPDGDAIGSALGLYMYLRKIGLDAAVIVPNDYPDFLKWLPGNDKVHIYEHNNQEVSSLILNADLLFSLDYNNPSRVGGLEIVLRKSKARKVLIDHHLQPDFDFFDKVISTINTSSTAELVYNFIKKYFDEDINREIAECLYAGILTDTGSFSYSCSNEHTFRVVADLFRHGIDGEKIHRQIYSTNSETRLRLLGYCLSEKLVVISEYVTAYITLTKQDLQDFEYKTGDTEGIVNYALSIKGIRFAAMFIERDNKIRISFRSTGDFSVNEFAREHFEGGGHKNAAGGDSYDDLDKTVRKFMDLLPKYIKLKK